MARVQPPLSPEFALVAACALLDDEGLAAAAPPLLGRPTYAELPPPGSRRGLFAR